MLNTVFRPPLYNEAGGGGEGGDGGGGGGTPSEGGGSGDGGNPLAEAIEGRGGAEGGGAAGGDKGGGEAGRGFEVGSLFADPGGKFAEGWVDKAIEVYPHLEPHRDRLAQYESFDSAMKGLGETKSHVGRKLHDVEVVLNPSPDDPAGMGLKRSLLDIPDEGTPQAYGYKAPEGLEDVVDEKVLGVFAEKAQEWGLSRQQFENAVNFQAELMKETGQSLEEAVQDADHQAQKQFWQEADKELGGEQQRKEALDLTVRLLRWGGMSDDAMREMGLHRMGVEGLKALVKIAKNTGEDRLPSGGGEGSQRMDAVKEYRSIIHDKSNPEHAIYHNPMHPDYDAVREKVFDLIKKGGPAKPSGW